MGQRGTRLAGYVVTLLLGVVLGGGLVGTFFLQQEEQWGRRRPYETGRAAGVAGPIPQAVAEVGPAVVAIRTRLEEPREGRSAFRDLLQPPAEVEAEGSGFIINALSGYVLTNAHVVRRAEQIMVTLSDGRDFRGKVLGADPVTDLAVVQIAGGNLPQAVLGDSGKLEPGSWVIAIGNPYGFANTVTVGVVSATGRTLPTPSGFPLSGLIQTDAAINRGNSGGALVDVAGNVVGIPTAMVPYANGLGFAVAINTAKQVVPELVRRGRVVRPWLGIRYTTVTAARARALGLGQPRGVVLVEVLPGGPAARAGLRTNDVLLSANNRALEQAEQLRRLVLGLRPGDRLTLAVWRRGKVRQVTVRLGEMPAEAGGG